MGLLGATSTNIIGMVGIGPFLTIPLMVFAMGGPHIIWRGWSERCSRLPTDSCTPSLGQRSRGAADRTSICGRRFVRSDSGGSWPSCSSSTSCWWRRSRSPAARWVSRLRRLLPAGVERGAPPPRRGRRLRAGPLPSLPEHRLGRAALEGDAGARARHHRLGDRGRPHRESGTPLVRPAAGFRRQLLAGARRRGGDRDVQLRRLQPGLQHRRRGEGPGAEHPALHPCSRSRWWPSSTSP